MERRRGFNYALVTAVTAVIGLLILRGLFTSTETFSTDFLSNRLLYGYVFAVTALIFLVLGYVLGRQADKLRRLSTTDSLTGLSNRRAFDDRLRDEWRRAARYGSPLAVLLVDIDGLKRINDQLGHRAGDHLLRRTATAIRHSLRGSDVGARWGGDEFAILAPQTSREPARQLAERLLVQLKKGSDSAHAAISASVGVAVFARDERATDDPDMLMRAADEALYRAKAGGRSQVKVA
jgi:two-component system, cell cycle response regulator